MLVRPSLLPYIVSPPLPFTPPSLRRSPSLACHSVRPSTQNGTSLEGPRRPQTRNDHKNKCINLHLRRPKLQQRIPSHPDLTLYRSPSRQQQAPLGHPETLYILPSGRPHRSRKLLSRRWSLDTFPPVRFLDQETTIPGLMARTDSTPDEHREGRRSNTRDTEIGRAHV